MRNRDSSRRPVLLALSLSVGLVTFCRAAPADDRDVPDDVAELVRRVLQRELEGDELVAAIPKLVDAYNEGRQYDVLQGLLAAFRQQPAAVADHVPAVAEILGDDSNERVICDVLQMLVQLDTLPAELETAVASRFRDCGMMPKTRAAAVLVKFCPKQPDAQQWLEESLTDDHDRQRRLNAAVAIGTVGPSASAWAALLRGRLVDPSAAVRVAVAGALLRIDAQAASDVSLARVTIESLSCPVEVWIVRPFYISEWLPSHRHIAVMTLPKFSAGHLEIANALANALTDHDEVVRLLALRGLATLGKSSAHVEEAVQRCLQDSDAGVAEQAAITLKLLNERAR